MNLIECVFLCYQSTTSAGDSVHPLHRVLVVSRILFRKRSPAGKRGQPYGFALASSKFLILLFHVELDLQNIGLVRLFLHYLLCLSIQSQAPLAFRRVRQNAEATVPGILRLAVTVDAKELSRSQQASTSFNCQLPDTDRTPDIIERCKSTFEEGISKICH